MAGNDFAMIHRRIEWFMHFFIDAMSSIDLDSRWRLFVAIRFFQTPSDLTRLGDEQLALQQLETPATQSRRAELESKVRVTWPKTDEAVIEEYAALLGGETTADVLHVSEHCDALIEKGTCPFEILGLCTVYQVGPPPCNIN